MALTKVHKTLYTPDGEVPIHGLGSERFTRREVVVLSEVEEFCVKNGFVIFCKQCEQPFKGQNNGSSRVLKMSCSCREYVYDGR